MNDDFANDIRVVQAIDAVPSILEVVCQTTGMGFAAVARVTKDRWIACGVRDEIEFGLQPGGELQIEETICNEIRVRREPVIIADVASDPVYSAHHTPKLFGLESYISVPIILPDGSFFGTLCAISRESAQVNKPSVIGMFRLFAEMIGYQIAAKRSVEKSEVALLDEQEASALREQFIAVLGHDLRNPLGAIAGGMRLLRKESLSNRGAEVLSLVESTASRMGALIENVMDFARGRLGGGISLEQSSSKVHDILEQIVSELRSSHPHREIITTIDVVEEVDCDPVRLGQLFSNLLGNAIMHGDQDFPISAILEIKEDALEFRTVNAGEPIADDTMKRLFAPFSRGEVRPSLQGLGLGLYIASQIAEAHDGTLTASSVNRETVFTFRMPVSAS